MLWRSCFQQAAIQAVVPNITGILRKCWVFSFDHIAVFDL